MAILLPKVLNGRAYENDGPLSTKGTALTINCNSAIYSVVMK